MPTLPFSTWHKAEAQEHSGSALCRALLNPPPQPVASPPFPNPELALDWLGVERGLHLFHIPLRAKTETYSRSACNVSLQIVDVLEPVTVACPKRDAQDTLGGTTFVPL